MTLKTEQASDDEFGANSIISRYYRDISPVHFTFRINSFSDLLKSNTPKHESDEFWASSFNWQDMYYTIQDVDGKIRRFRSTKREWGFDRFLRLQTLTDPSNGYIRDDCCIFGAEVFVFKHSGIMDDVNPYIWEIEKFSTFKDKEYYNSKKFLAGGYSWYYGLAFVLFKLYCEEKKVKIGFVLRAMAGVSVHLFHSWILTMHQRASC
ncbi:hypothetical protein LguiA_021479 [Lonicera macranthoides]